MDKNNIKNRFWQIDDLKLSSSFNPSTYYMKIEDLNKGYDTLFMAVESVSRYLYLINTNKNDKNEKIKKWINEYKPKYIWCDSRMLNAELKKDLNKINCEVNEFKAYSRLNPKQTKSGKNENIYLLEYKHPLSKVDRVSRTIREIINYLYKQEIMKNNWVENVKLIENIYNNHKHSILYDWVLDEKNKKMIKKYYTPAEVAFNKKLYDTMRFNEQLRKIDYNKKINNFKIGDFVRYKRALPTGYKKTNALSFDIYKIIDRNINMFTIQNIKKEDDIIKNLSYKELKKVSLFKPESTSFEEPTEKYFKGKLIKGFNKNGKKIFY